LTSNTLIRNNLLHRSGPVDRFTSLGVDGIYALVQRYWASTSFTFDDLDPARDLEARGVDDEGHLPHYYYRDDALRVWGHVRGAVEQIVDMFYDVDADVTADSELQVSRCASSAGTIQRNARKLPGTCDVVLLL